MWQKVKAWILTGYRPIDELSYPAVATLVALSGILATTLIGSNLAALKIWGGHGLPVDGGLLLFPISYIVGDLLVALYGRRVADVAALTSAAIACVLVTVMWIVAVVLPDYPGADNTAFYVVQSSMGRIFLASVAGFLSSQFVNNWLFVRLKLKPSGDPACYEEEESSTSPSALNSRQEFQARAILSSVLARIIDSLLFECLAFYGKLPWRDFFTQAILAYGLGLGLELLFSPLNKQIAVRLSDRIKYYDGRKI